jgi:ADP-heptose:LPS heptosyltransferase
VQRGYQVGITGSPGERELTAAVTAAASNVGVIDLGGQLSLRALAGALGTAQLLVSIATGPMHLAAAMGTPAVTLYGPTDLSIDRTRFSTHHSPQQQVLSPVTCPCASSHTCQNPVCMTAITSEAVLAAADTLV